MQLKLLEVSRSFRDASTKARDIARYFEQTAAVRAHEGGGWAVLVERAPDLALLIAKRMDEAERDRGPDDGSIDVRSNPEMPTDGYSSAEFSSDQDDWYRSYSDGWFYDE